MRSGTCFICCKNYARISQHLMRKHGFFDSVLKPESIKDYIVLLNHLPDINVERKVIKDHLECNKDLSCEQYKRIEKSFEAYKKGDIKLIIQIAKHERQRKHRRKGRKCGDNDLTQGNSERSQPEGNISIV